MVQGVFEKRKIDVLLKNIIFKTVIAFAEWMQRHASQSVDPESTAAMNMLLRKYILYQCNTFDIITDEWNKKQLYYVFSWNNTFWSV